MKIQDIFDKKIDQYFEEVKSYINDECTILYEIGWNKVYANDEEGTLILEGREGGFSEMDKSQFYNEVKKITKQLTEDNPCGLNPREIGENALAVAINRNLNGNMPTYCDREHI
ncbi:hypothetical protein [Nitrospira sp. BLG_2]|uniref:hypothetical protein n=1 Tax=Nitrospira sp. BLG_2 TaxID=3397507 RepID=UPI003B9A9AA5